MFPRWASTGNSSLRKEVDIIWEKPVKGSVSFPEKRGCPAIWNTHVSRESTEVGADGGAQSEHTSTLIVTKIESVTAELSFPRLTAPRISTSAWTTWRTRRWRRTSRALSVSRRAWRVATGACSRRWMRRVWSTNNLSRWNSRPAPRNITNQDCPTTDR